MSKTIAISQTVQRPQCPDCGGNYIISKGKDWHCKACGKYWRKVWKQKIVPKPMSLVCPTCSSINLVSRGPDWQCKDCRRRWGKHLKNPKKQGCIKGPVICQKCGKLRKHSCHGFCKNCWWNIYAKRNLEVRDKYLGIIISPKCQKKGQLFRRTITNRKTGHSWKRYPVSHFTYNAKKYRKKRKQGLSPKQANAHKRKHCRYLTAQQVIRLGFTP